MFSAREQRRIRPTENCLSMIDDFILNRSLSFAFRLLRSTQKRCLHPSILLRPPFNKKQSKKSTTTCILAFPAFPPPSLSLGSPPFRITNFTCTYSAATATASEYQHYHHYNSNSNRPIHPRALLVCLCMVVSYLTYTHTLPARMHT